ncbi:hypothetical protein NQ318_019843 [Aromia moschata]|uniref:Uncharacterized protein n=1 Tax=Aromia moschata TaxID=1265417 RepID=A0AAV8YK35_9CUCU|nr:hypothetical protein NQ318_019843 [Aromia moschata]
MKFFAVALFVFAFSGRLDALPRAGSDIAEQVKEVVQKVWAYVPEEIGIKDVAFSFPSTLIFGGDFKITDVSISGMKNLDIKTLTFDESTNQLDYEFDLGDVVGVVDYSFTIKGLMKFEHHFVFHSDLRNIKTEGHAVIAMEDGKPKQVSEFKILMTVGETDFDIQGFLNNENISKNLSEFLTKHGAETFDTISPMLSPIVSSFIKIAINIALNMF